MRHRKPIASKLRRHRFGRGLHLELLEPRLTLAGETVLLNFQLDEATIPTRYLRDSGQVFGLRENGLTYGWSSDHADQARERSVNPDQRLDTLVHFEVGQFWEFSLPNGNYEVTASIGDPSNASTHTLNVEGTTYWEDLPLAANVFANKTMTVTVTDGRLTIDQGAAADKATRINFVHIVNVPNVANSAPSAPVITEPSVDGQEVSPADVHMESIGYSDPDGNTHKSTDWEIWTVGPGAQPVWQTLGIEGIEKVHTHLGDGVFMNARAGQISLAGNTDYQLRVRYRDDVGSVSTYSTRLFHTTAASSAMPLELQDVAATPAPTWQTVFGAAVELPTGAGIFSPGDPIIAIDRDGFGSNSPGGEEVQNAIDGTLAKYLNFGEVNSGFIVTPSLGSSIVKSFQITTANDAVERDPSMWQLFGTNSSIVSTNHSAGDGEPWTLIASGSVALPTGRNTPGPTVAVTNNTAYASYRVVFTDVKNAAAANSMQIAEIQFFGEQAGTPPSLRLETGGTAELLLSLTGTQAPGNLVNNPAALASAAAVRVVVQAGTNPLLIANQTNLTFNDGQGASHTIYLPSISLVGGQRLDLWVAEDGSTYYGTPLQTEPDFSMLARPSESSLSNPFVPTQPGYIVEEVGSGYRLPVNIAFVPDPGPDPDDPLYYVTELYGSIQVVRRDGAKQTFASGLLDYNPQGPISGTGEQGLTGITVRRDPANPEVYQLFVSMLWDNGQPPGGLVHYPKVERINSVPGGLSMASRTVLLNMQPETQGQSHQISNVTIGPDGKLYVHMGEGFNAALALNLNQFRGKILRMNLDGSAPSDNPFYNAGDGITATDYIFAYGFRNPFGGAWRASDGKHYEVENGPGANDRLAQVNAGVSYGWDGSNASMLINAKYTWPQPHAPVNITFVQRETFNGSQFPASKMDHAFVSESGPTYATGPQVQGKRIVEFVLDANGNRVSGPTTIVEYRGTGQGSVVGLTAGPDGLYFTELYEDSGANGATAPGARIFRVRYVNPIAGDYDIDGDVDQDDYVAWRATFGSNLLLAADGNHNGVIDAADYVLWRNAMAAAGAGAQVRLQEALYVVSGESSAASGNTAADAALADLFLSEKMNSASSRRPSRGTTVEVTSDDDSLLLALPAAEDSFDSAPSSSSSGEGGSTDQASTSEIDDLFAELQLGLLSLR